MSTKPARMTAKSFRVQTASRMKRFREMKGFSQSQMADFMGITRDTYAYIEKSERDLKAFELYNLCKATGIESDYFFPWDMLGK